MLLHGHAPLAARYLAASGLGRLLVTRAMPGLAAADPAFVMEEARPGAVADVVLDLGDGSAWRAASGPRTWGGGAGGRVLLGVEPRDGAPPSGAARALLEALAAGEALLLLLGRPARRYELA